MVAGAGGAVEPLGDVLAGAAVSDVVHDLGDGGFVVLELVLLMSRSKSESARTRFGGIAIPLVHRYGKI
jgi:hypothetical protein